MVAYSFQQRFEAAVRDGRKTQTIRKVSKKRHVRVGEMIQLYTGMRSYRCRMIRPDVRCLSAQNIEIGFVDGGIGWIIIGDMIAENVVADLHAFAREDGFLSLADMAKFWREHHGPLNNSVFNGVLIRWSVDAEAAP